MKAAAIACAAIVVFGSGLFAKFFEDEYAYIAQSYYADIFFAGRFQDPAWLEFPAYDLPPLPKYLIGAVFRLGQLPMPRPGAASAWYDHYGHFGTPQTLVVARLPIVMVGAIGCVAIFACGVLVRDARVGIIAATLLMLNPLYRLHAHRAMSDVPVEAFMLGSLAFFLWYCRRIWSGQPGASVFLLPALAGISAGLALLSKFSGLLGLMIIAAWTGFALIAPRLNLECKLKIVGGSLMVGVVALAVFVGFNPFMTAEPTGPLSEEARLLAAMSVRQRFDLQVKHRFMLSQIQQRNFPKNALFTLAERLQVLAVQGFGRFGPLGPSMSDSRVRFDARQDWGMILWAPLVVLGLAASIRLGIDQFRSGQPPIALALVIWAGLAYVVVVFYLPMAWDRYLLPIQSGNALLVAIVAAALWDRLFAGGPAAETRT